MIRVTSALALVAATPAALAQVGQPHGSATDPPAAEQPAPAEPVLRVRFDEAEAMPGQPLDLRLTVLVPTFMPDPPVWPSLEAPNLLVRLPEGSTGPVSERLGSDTWSGVSRHYRVSPMIPGDFVIPPQSVVVTYADPETNEPTRATLSTDAIAFAGVLPEGAEGLAPFLAAEAVELSQEVEGDPSAMVPGESVTRTVTARITGTSPMFLPDLLPVTSIDGLAAYPDEPVVAETDDRGIPSGTRTESVTYVAEGGGNDELPGLSLGWYDLESGEVETASVDSLDEAHLASERHAFGVLQRVVQARDLPRLYPPLDDWARKVEGHDPRRHPALSQALSNLGAARYGRASGDEANAWRELRDALPEARRASASAGDLRGALPPLNPGA